MSLALASRKAALLTPWLRNPLWRSARAVPSLDLRFADNKSLADAVTGQDLITFTRASSGTFVDSQGVLQTASNNKPRFDHNPTTGESLGLLVEEQRTNLLVRSEEFTVSPWTLFGTASRSADVTVAPNGTQTADSVTLPVSSGIFSLTTGSENTTYTFSIWIRCDSTQSVRIVINTNLSDPTTKTVTATTTWQRFGVTKTTSPGTTSWSAQVDTGGGNTFYLWGAQLEAGAFPTSYIPTTTAAATRSADVASITGTNFSSWYRQDEGTVFADVSSAPVNNVAQLAYDISEGVGNERMFQRRSGSGMISTAVIDNGVTQADIGGVAISASARYRSGFAYKLNDIELVVNGGGSVTDTSATLPTLDRIHIGQNYASGQSCNGTIRRLVYWGQRLPNNVLQAITQ